MLDIVRRARGGESRGQKSQGDQSRGDRPRDDQPGLARGWLFLLVPLRLYMLAALGLVIYRVVEGAGHL